MATIPDLIEIHVDGAFAIAPDLERAARLVANWFQHPAAAFHSDTFDAPLLPEGCERWPLEHLAEAAAKCAQDAENHDFRIMAKASGRHMPGALVRANSAPKDRRMEFPDEWTVRRAHEPQDDERALCPALFVTDAMLDGREVPSYATHVTPDPQSILEAFAWGGEPNLWWREVSWDELPAWCELVPTMTEREKRRLVDRS